MKKTKIICILSFVVCLLLGNVVFAVEPSETEETECLSEISVSKEAEDSILEETEDNTEKTEILENSSLLNDEVCTEDNLVESDAINANNAYNISLVKTTQIIPSSSTQDLVNKGIILYKITVTATVRNTNGSIARNQAISFANYPQNANVKQVSYEGRTDSNGTAKAYYEVRGVTNFTVRAQCGRTQKSLSITPNEKCDYENTFYLTAYIIALESDYSASTKVAAAGISNYKFRKEFLDAVKLNGSGYSDDNKFYIRYNASTGNYEKKDPVTATGTTPTVGRTIAVDNYYIPRYNTTAQYGCVSIADVGKRKAEDAGGGIKKYHIDVFVGNGKAKANAFAYNQKYKKVTYLGNNKNI